MLSKEEFRELFLADLREKAKARSKQTVAKKKPRMIVTPSDFKKYTPWWRTAPPVVWVNIPTGQVLVNRWPLE